MYTGIYQYYSNIVHKPNQTNNNIQKIYRITVSCINTTYEYEWHLGKYMNK